MIGAINTFERKNMLERQREGIAIAVKAGKYMGRKKIGYQIIGSKYIINGKTEN